MTKNEASMLHASPMSVLCKKSLNSSTSKESNIIDNIYIYIRYKKLKDKELNKFSKIETNSSISNL